MRLIDADELKDGYMHMGYDPNEHPEESYMEGWCKGFNAAVDHCIGHVIHAPTIEPERKKGEWTFHKDGSGTCSECGITQKAVWDMDNWQNYCGHCGADMRGEQDGNQH